MCSANKLVPEECDAMPNDCLPVRSYVYLDDDDDDDGGGVYEYDGN